MNKLDNKLDVSFHRLEGGRVAAQRRSRGRGGSPRGLATLPDLDGLVDAARHDERGSLVEIYKESFHNIRLRPCHVLTLTPFPHRGNSSARVRSSVGNTKTEIYTNAANTMKGLST